VINEELKFPFYAKASIFIIGLFALVTILYIAQAIILPLIFAIIIAIVLHPVV
jgi:predicted PurR-regulated permease PerM